MKQPKTS